MQNSVICYRNCIFALVGANTTVTSSEVSVMEGGSVSLSCTATGVPVPTISWSLNNTAAPFTQTDSTTDFSATSETSDQVSFALGCVVSTLLVVSAQYPAHQGEYVCTGSNSYAGNTTITSAVITLQVQGEHSI